MELCDEWKKRKQEDKKQEDKNRRGGREEDRKTKGFQDENLPSTRHKNSMETHIPMLTRKQDSQKPNAAQPIPHNIPPYGDARFVAMEAVGNIREKITQSCTY